MKDLHLIRMDDLVTNPTPRVPVCLCLDTSGSMAAVEAGSYVGTGETIRQDGKLWQIVEGGKSRIQELQKGIEMFFEAIRTDILAADSAEISIVTFDNEAKCLLDFANIERQTVPQLHEGESARSDGRADERCATPASPRSRARAIRRRIPADGAVAPDMPREQRRTSSGFPHDGTNPAPNARPRPRGRRRGRTEPSVESIGTLDADLILVNSAGRTSTSSTRACPPWRRPS